MSLSDWKPCAFQYVFIQNIESYSIDFAQKQLNGNFSGYSVRGNRRSKARFCEIRQVTVKLETVLPL